MITSRAVLLDWKDRPSSPFFASSPCWLFILSCKKSSDRFPVPLPVRNKRRATGKLIHNLHQFKIEDEVLSRQGMIGIEYNGILIYFGNHHRKLFSGCIVHIQLHADFRMKILRQLPLWKFNDHGRIFRSLCLGKRNLNGFFITDGHALNAVIKALDDRAGAYLKFQRGPPVGRVEYGSVAQATVVMDLNGVSGCYGHNFIFLKNTNSNNNG